MSTPRTISPGRRVVLLVGVLALLVAVLLGLEWRSILVRYRVLRLESARTQEEAEPWLNALVSDSGHREIARLVVRKLGRGNQYFTFWVMNSLAGHPSASLPPGVGPLALRKDLFLPLLVEFQTRLEGDEGLLALWVHFLRWNDNPVLGASLDGPVCGLLSSESPVLREYHLRLTYLEFLGVAWFVGMQDLARCPRLDNGDEAESLTIIYDVAYRPIEEWMDENGSSLAFEPAVGRFLVKNGKDSPPVIPAPPKTPFLLWQGPVPELSIQLDQWSIYK